MTHDSLPPGPFRIGQVTALTGLSASTIPVSYTHLTLPTSG